MKTKTLVSWSSGKDSAWALHVLRDDPAAELVGLFSTAGEKHGRASMHATRVELLGRQAHAAGLPLEIIWLPEPCTAEQYGNVMQRFIEESAARGVRRIGFGDLFLEDIRRYREKQLRGTGIEPVFPVWSTATRELAEAMLAAGLEAYTSSVDLKKLPIDFVGRKWSRELIDELPADCDPCGENGELHTIVTGGPMFRESIPVRVGRTVRRDGFAYADILPADC
jgi:uncharacterized protein (TIGR00290 family)